MVVVVVGCGWCGAPISRLIDSCGQLLVIQEKFISSQSVEGVGKRVPLRPEGKRGQDLVEYPIESKDRWEGVP